MDYLEDGDIIYRKLQEHLDEMPIGFPRAKSGSDIRFLKYMFTPEEAKIATYLRFGWYRDAEPLDQIYERIKDTGITLEELEGNLDTMARKGSILSKRVENKKFFANTALILGMYEFQANKQTHEFLEVLEEYLGEIWGKEANKTGYQQMRYIPVEVDIEPELNIAPYDNIRKILVECEGPFVKVTCVCRESQDLLGEPCKMTKHRDNCLGFGEMAQMYIDQGYGVEISKEETLQILQRNKEEGLILRPSNSQKVDFVCSCCYCCDGSIANLQRIPDPGNYVLSNYYSQIDPELCTGCGTCIERCLFKAITLVDEKCSIEKIKCIGCGNCISYCPSEAISLHKKEEVNIPPPTMDDLYDLIYEKKRKVKNNQKKNL